MRVEFTCRFADKKEASDEEKQEEEIQKLINPEYVPEKKVKYTYDPMTLEIMDVSTWIRLDRTHTQLNMYAHAGGGFYIAKIPYLLFCKVYEDLTNNKIQVVQVTTEKLPSIQSSSIINKNTSDSIILPDDDEQGYTSE